MGEKMRIYVGGLGSTVQETDLKKTFTSPQLGAVQSVEIIRTKGRSFAYLEFLPASDKGLAKLFSTYNGCLWKGGRLKLEKAKDDYLSRLRREWAEDAQVEAILSSQNVDEDENEHKIQKPKKDQDIEKAQLKIFFPKLRKIKAIPLKGTGRHKYSFQRVEVPPLPIHFCDCEEHSGPPEPAKRNNTDDHKHSGPAEPYKRNNNSDDNVTDDYGVNEDELNMMKSILNKLLEKETCSETVSHQAELAEEINHDASFADKWQVGDNEEDQVSDDDNLVINIVGQSSKGVTLFEDWGQKTTTANQSSLAIEPESYSNPITEMHATKKGKHTLDKKRKQSIAEDKPNDTVTPKKKGRKGGQHDSTDDLVVLNTQNMGKESSSIRLISDAESSKKPAWRALVSEKGRTAFSISDLLTDLNSEVETNPRSDHLATAPCFNEKDGQQDKLSKHKESEIVSDVQSTKITASEDKSARDLLTDHNSEVETNPGSDHLATAPCSSETDGQKDQLSRYIELEKLSVVQSTKTTASEDKSARGASWLQKSSWLQLVGDANASAFSIGQILPDLTSEKQELQQPHDIDFSNLSGKQHNFVHKDKKSPFEDDGEIQGKADKKMSAKPGNPTVDVLTKGQNHGALDGGQLNSDSRETVKEESSLAPTLGANLVPNNRAVGDTVISETCPFMRSAASVKEWAKSKAALSGSHKKKGAGKESVQH